MSIKKGEALGPGQGHGLSTVSGTGMRHGPGYTTPGTPTLHHRSTSRTRTRPGLGTKGAMGSNRTLRNSQTGSQVNLRETIWALAPV